MLIYLDTCCLQRPLDDRSQPRINIEAEAVLTILGIIEKNNIGLVSSEVLEYEISQIPDRSRENKVREILAISDKYVTINDEIELKANQYMKEGIKPMDALHLASAIVMNIDYFCTADDKFLKKAKKINTSSIKITSPLELVIEVSE
jgi:predicted nucleic acid-binding protein